MDGKSAFEQHQEDLHKNVDETVSVASKCIETLISLAEIKSAEASYGDSVNINVNAMNLVRSLENLLRISSHIRSTVVVNASAERNEETDIQIAASVSERVQAEKAYRETLYKAFQ
eukprot:TRINITY_DN4410_c0_g1_i2.p1 TRINITY_DN4410_c0_g1~~TRINITY_DN4410_c0_g1_i2.p1  ORF type:complete len:116 (+),score=19.90 TRINITY_DN4410_c0_g1_i2:187-534(+)